MTSVRQQGLYFHEEAWFVSYPLKLSNADYCALSNVDTTFRACLYGGFHMCFYSSDIYFRYY